MRFAAICSLVLVFVALGASAAPVEFVAREVECRDLLGDISLFDGNTVSGNGSPTATGNGNGNGNGDGNPSATDNGNGSGNGNADGNSPGSADGNGNDPVAALGSILGVRDCHA